MTGGTKIKGIVRPEPTRSAGPGTQLHFDAIAFEITAADTRGFLPPDALRGMLLTVSFRDDGGHHTIGSAAMLGPGLALGAYHVFQDFIEPLQNDHAAAVCEAPSEHGLLFWEVHRFTVIPIS